jgi:hypothetical protein
MGSGGIGVSNRRLRSWKDKFWRADAQFNQLWEEIGTFIEGDAYAAGKYFDTQAQQYVFRGRVIKEPLEHWPVLIGECLHNFRSALDSLAWELARTPPDDPPRGTTFPIFRSAGDYRNLWSARSGYYATRGMPVEAQAIIEDAQPYQRGNAADGHPLWVLHSLSNEDKHRTFHLAGAALGAYETEVVEQVGVTSPKLKFFRGPFKDGAVIARMNLPKSIVSGQGEMHMKIRFGFGVAFPKDGPARGVDVRQVLADIRNQVAGAGKRLEPLVGPPLPEPPPERPGPTELPLA